MEKGEMRVEANISISDTGALGTKVEVKNLNSFRSVERAIAYEIERHTKLLEAGTKVEQETLGWDEAAQKTYVQRKKEKAHDYRYFPDPDLPKLKLSELPEFDKEALEKELPELPWQKRERFISLGIQKEYVDLFVQNERLAGLFDAAEGDKKLAANYIGSDIAGLIAKNGEQGLDNITPAGLSAMTAAIAEGKLSSRGAKDALAEVFAQGGALEDVIAKYEQQSDEGALLVIAQKVVDQNPAVVADYKAGKEAAMQFLVGQGMKESRGKAAPAALRTALLKIIQ
jgi:aspartyl-tRNA(Asn)/glutamyl-tRNA(Gln) amidotransferase subunit B